MDQNPLPSLTRSGRGPTWAEHDAIVAGVVAAMQSQIDALTAKLTAVLGRVAELEAQVKTNSGNSSKPPSSDMPGVKRRPQKEKGKKAGGQEGHEGKTFQPFAAEAVAETKPLTPTACVGCGIAFGPDAIPTGAPVTFQTVDLPPIIPLVIEFQRHELCCPDCGGRTRAPLPDEVGLSPFGPRLSAVIAAWAIKFHLSRRQIQALCHSLFNLAISVGAIQAIIERVAVACEQPVADLQAAVQSAAVVHADETGHAHQGGGAKKKRHWLWVATTSFAAIYVVAADRGQTGLGKLLGKEFKGVVCCDRWRPYESLFGDNRQLCWSHLGREGQSAIDRAAVMLASKDASVRAKGDSLLAWGQAFLAIHKAMFKSWNHFKDGGMCRKGLFGAMVSHKVAFAQLFRHGAQLDDTKAAGTCRDLIRQWRVLWTFVTVPGVEPTNNEAERAVRQPVLLRRKSGGTRSEKGKKALGILLSVVETCRRQNRQVIDYFEDVMRNLRRGQPPPSLVTA